MASDSLAVIPVHMGIHPSLTVVMPVKTGIQFLGSEDWIPAFPGSSPKTGMTEAVEREKPKVEGKGRGKKK